jgi:glutamyl-tRNA synthetase
MATDEFAAMALPHVEEALGRRLSETESACFREIAPLVQERTKLLPEAGEQVTFLFEEFEEYDTTSWEKVMINDGVADVLDLALRTLEGLGDWSVNAIETALRALPERLGIGAGKTFQPLRVAVTGSSVSPPLFESLAALGRDRTLTRLKRARMHLG